MYRSSRPSLVSDLAMVPAEFILDPVPGQRLLAQAVVHAEVTSLVESEVRLSGGRVDRHSVGIAVGVLLSRVHHMVAS